MLGFGKDVRLDNPGGFDNLVCGEAARVLCDARTVRAKRATLRVAAGVAHLRDLGDTEAKLGAKGATARIAAGMAHLRDLADTKAKLGAKGATAGVSAGMAHLRDLADTEAKLRAERATAGVAAGVAHLSDSLLARVNKANTVTVGALVADFFGDELWSFRD